MKRELKTLLLANLLLIIFILYYTFDLHMLIIDDNSEEAIPSIEIAPNSTLLNYPNNNNENVQLIPKIIHQTYKDENIPHHWQNGQNKCQELNPDYQYILWTDEMIENFISENFEWFLPTLKSYKYPIQKADIIRYFVLVQYGGIYIDLDDTCERNLDPLLKYPVVLRKTSPFGVSNDLMGSIPNHPFFQLVINKLNHYNKNWYTAYFTIMASTGPVFISIVWKQYKRWCKIRYYLNDLLIPNGYGPKYVTSIDSVRVLEPWDYKDTPNAFFSISKGSSWHLDDATFIKSFLTHILSCVVAGFILGFCILYGEYCCYCFMCNNRKNSGNNNTTTATITSTIWIHLQKKFNLITRRRNDDSTRYYNNDIFDEHGDNGPVLSFKKQRKSTWNNNNRYSRLRKDSNNLMNFVDLEKNHF